MMFAKNSEFFFPILLFLNDKLFFYQMYSSCQKFSTFLVTYLFMLLLLLSCFSCVRLCVTPQTAAHQAPLSLGFSRQEHWSGLPFPSPNLQNLHLFASDITVFSRKLIFAKMTSIDHFIEHKSFYQGTNSNLA